MHDSSSDDLTQLLGHLGDGNDAVQEKVLGLVYERLRGVAQRLFVREPEDHSLVPTEVVHAAWQKLSAEKCAQWQAREQFFAVSATVMRRILVDHARSRARRRAQADSEAIPLTCIADPDGIPAVDLLDLDEQMQVLAGLDERQHRIIELRFFSGLTVAEVADILGISKRSVEAEWSMAKSWLRRRLGRGLS